MKTKRILSFILSLIMCFAIAGVIPAMAAPAYSTTQYYNDSIIAYEDLDLSDDQIITDEAFFGLWDEETGDWKEGYVPYFYYEEYPALYKVEEAAKLGDYETCKEEILAFYREKRLGYRMGYTDGILSDASRAAAELTFTSSAGTNAVGTTYFTRTPSWKGINLQTAVTQKLSQGVTTLIYSICATNKDGYRLEVGRSGEYMPYIVIEVNGETKTYKAKKATYVDGLVSDYRDLDPDNMLIEESVTSINSEYHRDENTKRGFFQFDFSGITENDQIGGVTLYLYGKMVDDDIVDEPRYERSYKKLHVFTFDLLTDLPLAFNYDTLNEYGEYFWNNDGEMSWRRRCTRYGDGSPWDTGFGGDAAEAYRLTGDETFAYHSIRNHIMNIKYFGDYDQLLSMGHHALNMASWGYSKVWAIDKLMPSKHMTPEAFTYILKGIHIRLEWLEKNWLSMYEGHNWGGYAVQGILAPTLFFHEFRAAHGDLWRNPDGSYYLDNEFKGSVRGGWLEVANYRNSFKVGGSMNEDGSSVEAPIGYTFESLGAYLKPKEFGEKLNYDYSVFYTPKVEDDSDYIYAARERMRRALVYLASITNPIGGHFQVGDSAGWDQDILGSFKKGYLDYLDDPELEYIVYKGERGTKPSFLTVTYEGNYKEGEVDVMGGKVACFRNDWNDTAVAAMFQAWGRAGHSHQDDLSISLMAYGNYLLTDQRMNNYDEEDRLERWVSSTRGHNVVEINDATGKGGKVYAVQYDPMVFESTIDENGNEVPVVDENGVAKVDDPLWVDTSVGSSWGAQSGSIFPEDREINNVYDYIKGKTYTYVDCANPALYNEDFDLRRNVLFLRSGYFIVTDYCKPYLGLDYKYQDDYMKENNIEGHKYKQMWHFTNEANIEINEENNTVKTNFPGAANIVVATVKNNDNMHLQYKYGLYPVRRGVFAVTKYATFQQYKKGQMTFNTILYPTPVGQDAEITTQNIELDMPEDTANAFKATITDTNRNQDTEVYYYTLLDYEKKAPVTFATYETDGTLALSEVKLGNYVNSVLRNGKYLKNAQGNEYVIYSKDELVDIGVSWQNEEIDIAYNADDSYNTKVDLERLTVRANNKVSTVRFNGEEVDFKQDGKYIYFGDDPILDGGDTIPGENEESEGDSIGGNHATGSPSGGSSSGGSSSGGGGSSSGNKDKDNEKPVTPPVVEPEPTIADAYKDELEGHWAQKEITNLVNDSVVEGFADGTLGLDRNITRAQFITLLVRALELDIEEYEGAFKDVTKDNWHADYMATAVKNGWLQGDGTNAYPDRNITREEITKILVSAYEQKYGEITALPENKFSDSQDISSWAENFVNKAAGAGLVNGMGDDTFKPKANAKREQAMVLIYRLMNKKQ